MEKLNREDRKGNLYYRVSEKVRSKYGHPLEIVDDFIISGF